MPNHENPTPPIEEPKKPATDAEIAEFLLQHLANPCEDPRNGINIRHFYIEEANRVLETMPDSETKRQLQELVRACSK